MWLLACGALARMLASPLMAKPWQTLTLVGNLMRKAICRPTPVRLIGKASILLVPQPRIEHAWLLSRNDAAAA